MGVRVATKVGVVITQYNTLLLSLSLSLFLSLSTFVDACPPYLLQTFFKFPSLFFISFSLSLHFLKFSSQSAQKQRLLCFPHIFFLYQNPKGSTHSCQKPTNLVGPPPITTHPSLRSLQTQVSLSPSFYTSWWTFGSTPSSLQIKGFPFSLSQSSPSLISISFVFHECSHQGQPNIHSCLFLVFSFLFLFLSLLCLFYFLLKSHYMVGFVSFPWSMLS